MPNNLSNKKNLEYLEKNIIQELAKEYSKYSMKDNMRYELDEFKKEIREREKRHQEKYIKILEKFLEIVRLLNND